MERQQESLLFLAVRGLRFASNHPYAATGIFGAVVGSAITYSVLTNQSPRQSVNGFFTPKVYELVLPRVEVEKLLLDPNVELRWETPTMTVIVSMEKPEPLKQLPFIDVNST